MCEDEKEKKKKKGEKHYWHQIYLINSLPALVAFLTEANEL